MACWNERHEFISSANSTQLPPGTQCACGWLVVDDAGYVVVAATGEHIMGFTHRPDADPKKVEALRNAPEALRQGLCPSCGNPMDDHPRPGCDWRIGR